MTSSVLDRAVGSAARPERAHRWPTTVLLAIVALVAIRLLAVHGPPAPDEGGFLMVAGQWSQGSSLYGHYWVDRPPLLIGIFALADLAGGLVALRVLGIVAAVLALLLLSSTSRRLFGHRAAAWTAVVSTALLCSPLFGSREVNGELLALPFVALGLRAAVEAVLAEDAYVARAAAVVTGLATACSIMVKQNIADVVVFAVVAWLVAGRRRARLLAHAGIGTIAGLVVILLAAMSRGTSPLALYEALYPFRVRAGSVLVESAGGIPVSRAAELGGALLVTGAPLVVLVFAGLALRRPRVPWLVWGLSAMATYDVFSIAAGGGYWAHYEVELLPAVTLMAGAVATWAPKLLAGIVAVVVLSAVLSITERGVVTGRSGGAEVAQALAPAVQPGDTIISAFGDADIPYSTAMSSPYPYLWSLPSRVLDPRMALLRGILSGPSAPTWVVIRGPGTAARLADSGSLSLIHRRYHEVALVRGRQIYLRDGLHRPEVTA